MDESELEDTAYHAGRFNDVAREALKQAIAARGLNIVVEDDFKRPLAVTVLALLVFLDAAFCLLLVILACVRPELILSAFISRHGHSPEALKAEVAGIAVFDSIAAVANIVIGFGLWSLRWWARLVLLISSGAGLARWGVALLVTTLFSPTTVGHVLISIKPIGILINAAILCLLTQPEVERVFDKPPGMPNWP